MAAAKAARSEKQRAAKSADDALIAPLKTKMSARLVRARKSCCSTVGHASRSRDGKSEPHVNEVPSAPTISGRCTASIGHDILSIFACKFPYNSLYDLAMITP